MDSEQEENLPSDGGEDSDTGAMQRLKYTTTKKKKEALLKDFYKFQLKDYKKQKLEELRKGFEEDKRRLAKLEQKQRAAEEKHTK